MVERSFGSDPEMIATSIFCPQYLILPTPAPTSTASPAFMPATLLCPTMTSIEADVPLPHQISNAVPAGISGKGKVARHPARAPDFAQLRNLCSAPLPGKWTARVELAALRPAEH